MNPELSLLQPYPFERLRSLFQGVVPSTSHRPIQLHIGEPKHPTPQILRSAVTEGINGLAYYPATAGSDDLRSAIRDWLVNRHGIEDIDPTSEILPVNGSREALFAIAQVIVHRSESTRPIVICPNPFYQIYEGAAILAGAVPHFVNMTAANGFAGDYKAISEKTWQSTQLLYVCSPANPTGRVTTVAEWEELFDLADRYGFVIASDECYSELYFPGDEPPIGALAVAKKLGRAGYERLIMFSSLSKRSNVPGMRSGFVAGDRKIIKDFLLYRTYHGSAMSPLFQSASAVAWRDELHVSQNREQYSEKFQSVVPLLKDALPVSMPEASFYLWIKTPISDTEFARELYRRYNLTVLPGSFLGRLQGDENPGAGFIRIALVAPLSECIEAAGRLTEYAKSL